MGSGQRMKKFSSQKEERVKFIPNKIWTPFRTQVSVKQVKLLSSLFSPLATSSLHSLSSKEMTKPMSSSQVCQLIAHDFCFYHLYIIHNPDLSEIQCSNQYTTGVPVLHSTSRYFTGVPVLGDARYIAHLHTGPETHMQVHNHHSLNRKLYFF